MFVVAFRVALILVIFAGAGLVIKRTLTIQFGGKM